MLERLDRLEAEIAELTRRVEEEVKKRPAAVRVADASGSGAADGIGHGADAGAGGAVRLGETGGQLLGLIPSEHSSGGRQQLGRISKQGSAFLRFYRRLAMRKHRALAKVAVARKLATRLYLMLREDWDYAQLCKAGCAGAPESFCGRKLDRALELGSLSPRRAGRSK